MKYLLDEEEYRSLTRKASDYQLAAIELIRTMTLGFATQFAERYPSISKSGKPRRDLIAEIHGGLMTHVLRDLKNNIQNSKDP